MHKLWPKMEEIYKSGKAKTIGVSNFNVQLLLDLLSYAEIKPAVNQIELHPYLPQIDAVEWYKKVGVMPVAFSPFVARKPRFYVLCEVEGAGRASAGRIGGEILENQRPDRAELGPGARTYNNPEIAE